MYNISRHQLRPNEIKSLTEHVLCTHVFKRETALRSVLGVLVYIGFEPKRAADRGDLKPSIPCL
jgi:hypothetical protein